MRFWPSFRLLCIPAAGLILTATGRSASAGEDLFRSTVQPTLKQQCLGCHGEGNTFANLDLRTREAALKGGQRGPAIVSGDPDASLLVRAVDHVGELHMPPGGEDNRLPEDIRQALRDWISAGAPYSAGESAVKWKFEESDIWAFRPIGEARPPSEGVEPSRVRTPVDSFLLARLAKEGIEPGPRASRLTLIRRLTFDLTGLPPTPEEVDAFLSDESSGAYNALVERLLESPRYGERWGRHWLDVTRYADSAGYSNDFE